MSLMNNRIRTLVAEGKTVKGSFIFTREPAYIEVMGYAGFDFIIIDNEHSPLTVTEDIHLVRAAEIAGIEPVIRVSANEPAQILQALDVGATTLLVPRVNTAEDAKAVVRAAKYGPLGERGLAGVVRAAKYGFIPCDDYIATANQNIFVMVQIEEVEAVRNVDEILAVEGIDAIFIGPADLSQSMGLTGQFDHPEFCNAVAHVISRAQQAGKPVSMFFADVESAKKWEQAGVQILTVSGDTSLLAEAAGRLLQELKK